jgi:hypothetical protein
LRVREQRVPRACVAVTPRSNRPEVTVSTSVSYRSLAVALVAACIALPVASRLTSATQGPPPPVRPVWPPHASNIFNLDSASAAAPSGGITSGAGSSTVLYTVPSDRYLVLTDAEITANNSGPTEVSLVEDLGGVVTIKRGPSWNQQASTYQPVQGLHSSVGLTFAPGSQIALRNSGVQCQVMYTLTGYFAAP